MPQKVAVPTDDELKAVLQTLAESVMENFGDDTPDHTQVDISMANGKASIEINYQGVNKKLKEDARTLFKQVHINRKKERRRQEEEEQESEKQDEESERGQSVKDVVKNHL